MADPWRVLGLAPESADEKQVRSAYARLLKVHRPDQDPEGFQQLRSAYQFALDWLKHRAAPEPEEWADDFLVEDEVEEDVSEKASPPPVVPPARNTPPPLPSSWAPGAVPVLPHRVEQEPSAKPEPEGRPERNWPREWSYSLVSLDRALQGTEQDLPGVSSALKALASDVVEYGIPPFALEAILDDAFHAKAALFGSTTPAIIIALLLQGDRMTFLTRVLDAMEQAGNQMNMAVFAQRLDDCLPEGLSPRTTDLYFRAATLAALHKPFIAQSIARKLSRSLEASANSAKFDQLHAAITRGMALRDLTPLHRSFWSRQLNHPDAPCDWQASVPQQALEAVVLLGRQWPGSMLVQGVVPADVWKAAWKGRLLRITLSRASKVLHPRNLTVTGFAVLGGGMLIFGAHLFTAISPVPKSNPSRPAKVELSPGERQRQEEFRKHLLELKAKYEKQQQEKDRTNAR
ncbi:hypothetical protein [Prosthecobacter sp.]|uniref:hypothetical protein n=1 Tax=Prosthecobacter sp. TaxID=1965333 RepID=UPI003782D781